MHVQEVAVGRAEYASACVLFSLAYMEQLWGVLYAQPYGSLPILRTENKLWVHTWIISLVALSPIPANCTRKSVPAANRWGQTYLLQILPRMGNLRYKIHTLCAFSVRDEQLNVGF